MGMPFISFLVMSYNQKPYIKRGIDSILKQRHPYMYEILIADDCSSDGTIDYLKKEYATQKIIYLDTPRNLGVSKNYQRAFSACRGEYIAILEADDYWLSKKRIARMVSFLEEHKEYAFAANRFLAITEDSMFYHPAPKQKGPIRLMPDDIVYYPPTGLFNMASNFSTCVYRAAAIRKLDPQLFEHGFYDWGINLGVAQHGPCAYFKELMSVYSIRKDSTWNSLSPLRQRLDFFKGLHSFYKVFPNQKNIIRKGQIAILKQPVAKIKNCIKRAIKMVTPPIVLYIARYYKKYLNPSPKNPYYCPLCSSHVSAFWPLGEELMVLYQKYDCLGERFTLELFSPEKFSCPSCGAMDRERLVAQYLLRRFETEVPKPDFRMLEFAPRQAVANFLQKNFTIRHETADLLMPDVDYIVDISTMTQFADETYDAWICLHVLEHVRDDVAALRELYRILKPGGFGILLVPLSLAIPATEENLDALEEERWRRFGQGDHIRLYAQKDFVLRVCSAGFHVHELDITYFGKKELKKMGLPETPVLYVVER